MAVETINLMAMRINVNNHFTGLTFQKSARSLYTKPWFDDVLQNAPFINWETDDNSCESDSESENDDEIANAETEIESGMKQKKARKRQIQKENDEEENCDQQEEYVSYDHCGVADIDPADVTGSEAINLAERGGGYIHEYCQEAKTRAKAKAKAKTKAKTETKAKRKRSESESDVEEVIMT